MPPNKTPTKRARDPDGQGEFVTRGNAIRRAVVECGQRSRQQQQDKECRESNSQAAGAAFQARSRQSLDVNAVNGDKRVRRQAIDTFERDSQKEASYHAHAYFRRQHQSGLSQNLTLYPALRRSRLAAPLSAQLPICQDIQQSTSQRPQSIDPRHSTSEKPTASAPLSLTSQRSPPQLLAPRRPSPAATLLSFGGRSISAEEQDARCGEGLPPLSFPPLHLSSSSPQQQQQIQN